MLSEESQLLLASRSSSVAAEVRRVNRITRGRQLFCQPTIADGVLSQSMNDLHHSQKASLTAPSIDKYSGAIIGGEGEGFLIHRIYISHQQRDFVTAPLSGCSGNVHFRTACLR